MSELLFSVTLLELFIGGGGRLLEVGPVTVRMILFALCLCASLLIGVYRPRKDDGLLLALGLVVTYLIIHVGALLHGVGSGHNAGDGMLELQQSLYWLAAPFMALVLRSLPMVERAAFLIRLSGVVLALGYIAVVAGLALGAIDYLTLYARLDATGEFFFRGEGFFFYKGFLYLCIATIFFLALPSRYSFAWLVLLLIALAMTLTRGLVLATSFAALMMLIAQRRWKLLSLALALVVVLAFFLLVYLPSEDDVLMANREMSNSQRLNDFAYIADNFRVGTLLYGEGLGALINERLNVENTFLWALWRLGVVGVCFWLAPLALCLHYYLRIDRGSPHFRMACAYFFSTVLLYVQTLTNPYLNNPIGLSFVLVAIFSLRTLARSSPRVPRAGARPPPPVAALEAA